MISANPYDFFPQMISANPYDFFPLWFQLTLMISFPYDLS